MLYIKRIILGLCCLLIGTSAAYAVPDADTHKIKDVSQNIVQLRQSLSTNQDMATKTEQQLQFAEVALSNASEQINLLNQELITEQNEMTTLNADKENYTKQLAKQRTILAEQIRLIYQLGQMQSAKNILNPDNFNAIDRHLYYSRYLGNQRAKLLAEIKRILINLDQTVKEANLHEAKLKNLLQEKQDEQKSQMLAQQERQQLLVKLLQNSLSKKQQLDRLTVNQQNLQDVLDASRNEDTKVIELSFPELKGKLAWPVIGSINNEKSTIMEEGRSLPGVIIKAPEGTPVHAIANGRVVFADWLRGYGLLVIINHGDGYMSLYARNHTLYAKMGAKVKAGDIIADSGSSGGFRTAGLYFEIRRQGAPVNPHAWCV